MEARQGDGREIKHIQTLHAVISKAISGTKKQENLGALVWYDTEIPASF